MIDKTLLTILYSDRKVYLNEQTYELWPKHINHN